MGSDRRTERCKVCHQSVLITETGTFLAHNRAPFIRWVCEGSHTQPEVNVPHNIYLASSWRNARYPAVLAALRAAKHEVYDFRSPPDGTAFSWKQTDPDWQPGQLVAPKILKAMLAAPIAQAGFKSDRDALRRATATVLLLECGKSAHLELGWSAGFKDGLTLKAGWHPPGVPIPKCYVLMEEPGEPELMYKLCGDDPNALCTSLDELIEQLAR